ncbi:MAG: biotin/lipoyl-binding protein [Gammaproteobacteria bacterium]|nr:biotin/lipoyl-binding protein [Gammaproteobacteria bacterium]
MSNLITTHDFATCTHDIKYVENNLPELTAQNREIPSEILVLALLYLTSKSTEIRAEGLIENDDKYSPWRTNSGWRHNSRKEIACSFECNDQIFNVSALLGEQQTVVKIKEREFNCFNIQIFDHAIEAMIDEVEWSLPVILLEDEIYLFHQSSRYGLRPSDRLSAALSANVDAGSLTAPLPGRIARVLVEEGESVSTGQVLIVVEAMKMEHPIASPIDGVVTSVPFSENELVDEGASCVFVEPSKQSDRSSNNE